MESGSWQVRVQVEGAQGAGELAVPVPAAARGTMPMEKSLGVLLFALMSLLVVSIIPIVGAARREATLPPGQSPTEEHSRRGRWMMVGTAVVVFGILYFGNWWWNSEASAKARQMIYKAPPLDASLQPGGKLLLKMGNSEWHRTRPETVMTNLMPNHGHLMHLFLLREPAMDRFYRLHPHLVPPPSPAFMRTLEFRLSGYAGNRCRTIQDLCRRRPQSGFPDTMIAEIDLPDIPGVALTGDNSAAATTNATADSTTAILPDGYKMTWERGTAPFVANHFVWLRFRVETPDGKPVTDAEPYMGMAGHAEIVSSDRSGLRAHSSRWLGSDGRAGTRAEKFSCEKFLSQSRRRIERRQRHERHEHARGFGFRRSFVPLRISKTRRVSSVRTNEAGRNNRNRRVRYASDSITRGALRFRSAHHFCGHFHHQTSPAPIAALLSSADSSRRKSRSSCQPLALPIPARYFLRRLGFAEHAIRLVRDFLEFRHRRTWTQRANAHSQRTHFLGNSFREQQIERLGRRVAGIVRTGWNAATEATIITSPCRRSTIPGRYGGP